MGLHHWCDRSPSEQPAPVDAANCSTNVWQWTTCNSMPTGAAATALFPPNAMTFFLYPSPIASNARRLAKTITPGDSRSAEPTKLERRARGTLFLHSKCRKRLCNRDGIVRKRQKYSAKEIIWKSERLKKSRRNMDFYHRRCNSRRTPAGSFARWRILGAKYARLASADFC